MKKDWTYKDERYFGIGIYQPKTEHNIGTLWRTAHIFGASFIFVIGGKYTKHASDILKVWSKIPLLQFDTIQAFLDTCPYSCKIVGLELHETAIPIHQYTHPDRAIYLLGSENNGLPKQLIDKCHDLIQLPGARSLNVAVAGSITVFDRINKFKLEA